MAATQALSSSQFAVPDAPKGISSPPRQMESDNGIVPLSGKTNSSASARTAWATSSMRRGGTPLPYSSKTGGSVYNFE
jgi:hypothetical protein